jgi:hypothetical protein
VLWREKEKKPREKEKKIINLQGGKRLNKFK